MIIFKRLPNTTTVMSLLLIVALLVSGWLARNLMTGTNNTKANQPTTPDAFMIGMHFTQFDPQGQWKSTFTANRMTHYASQDTAVFLQPVLVSRENTLTWVITAEHGTDLNSGATVFLKDHVQIQRFENNQKNLDLTTSALTSYPKRHFMETDQPVTIVQPGSTMQAIGMTANMQTGDIRLLSKAQGVYQPPPPTTKQHTPNAKSS